MLSTYSKAELKSVFARSSRAKSECFDDRKQDMDCTLQALETSVERRKA